MKRSETTKWLGALLEKRIDHRGSYFATEVSIDYGKLNVRRIDYLQFEPAGVMEVSGIEKGIFTCYEIKSCKADYESGFGKNFIGEKNYLIVTMPTYIDLVQEMPPSEGVGVLVACPPDSIVEDEFECPREPNGSMDWELKVVIPARQRLRQRSMTELLFCMLRSGH